MEKEKLGLIEKHKSILDEFAEFTGVDYDPMALGQFRVELYDRLKVACVDRFFEEKFKK